jgi:hypothetical protein
MPPKKEDKKAAAAAAAAPAVPAAPAEPLPPPDLGPVVDPKALLVRSKFKVFDPENTSFIATSDVLTLLHTLSIFATEEEFQKDILPDLGSAGERGRQREKRERERDCSQQAPPHPDSSTPAPPTPFSPSPLSPLHLSGSCCCRRAHTSSEL